MRDSILWVGPSRRDMAGTWQDIADGWCTTKPAIKGRGWGEQAQLYIYNGNLLQFSTYARLGSVAGGTDFCEREVLVCMRKRKICRREVILLAG